MQMEFPQEYDDPNSTIASILNAARDLVFVEYLQYFKWKTRFQKLQLSY